MLSARQTERGGDRLARTSLDFPRLVKFFPRFEAHSHTHGYEFPLGDSGVTLFLSGSVAPIIFQLFFGDCPTKNGPSPKKGSFFAQGH